MELSFLGTSSGVPTKERNISSITLKANNSKKWCLIDCGEGTQQQILNTNLSLIQLEAIFITHIHGDHCYGLPGLLASAGMSGRKENLFIIAPKKIFKFIDSVIKTTELYLPYKLDYIDVKTLGNKELEQFKVSSIKLSHRVPSYAYIFELNITNNKLKTKLLKQAEIPPAPYWGEIQKGNDIIIKDKTYSAADYLEIETLTKKAIICGDNDNPELLIKEVQDTDVIVHESTYTHKMLLKVGSSPMHCSAKRIAKFSQSIRLRNLVLTHFSPRYISQEADKNSISQIKNEAKKHYKGNLFLANDFDSFILDKKGMLTKQTHQNLP